MLVICRADAGPVIFQEGDYYGQTVNVASRIAEYAPPGEVLVSQEVVDASGGAEVAYREITRAFRWAVLRLGAHRPSPADPLRSAVGAGSRPSSQRNRSEQLRPSRS